MKLLKRLVICSLSLALVFGLSSKALSIGLLQLYIEGANYNSTTETWVWDPITGPSTITLWAIGNVNGPGGKGSIDNVFLVAAYPDPMGATAGFQFTGTTTGGLGGFTDPSTPVSISTAYSTGADTPPTLSDGSSMPSHGIYGTGIDWQTFALGDFTLTDSPVADFFAGGFPPSSIFPNAGQINAYEVSFSGVTTPIHFDLFGDYIKKDGSIQPTTTAFSHDAAVVPEPATMLLLGTGLIGMAAIGRRKFRKK